MNKTQQLYKKAKQLLPGATGLLSKRAEMFAPDIWPAYYSKAKGFDVWDLDDKHYKDFSYMGIGSCILGYSNDYVNNAVKKCIDDANMSTLNSPYEVELTQLMLDMHPWASKAKYTRSGGEAMSVAVRIARAKSKKDVVLFCGYHGWHDWYLSANLADDSALDGHLLKGLSPRGVPRGLKGSSYPFKYNDINSFLDVFEKYKDEIGVIVMEPIRNVYPSKEFIKTIQEKAKSINAILVVDEITAGFRLNNGGAHLSLDIQPDIAVFAKSISNGFAFGCVIGKEEVMDEAENTFISSTYWTEGIGFVSAIATIEQIKKHNVVSHINKIGKQIQDGWNYLAKKHMLDIEVSGLYPLSHFAFQYKDALILKTIFTILMLERGYLATNAFYASFAQKEKDIKEYLNSVDEVFAIMKTIIKENNIKNYLKSPVCHSGFQRLT